MTPSARIGGAIVLLFLAVGLGGTALCPYDPGAIALADHLHAPSLAHPLGQDPLGRDVLSRLLAGARVSLVVGVAAVSASLVVGTAVGLICGLRGGWLDEAVMRLVDVLLAFPGILLAVALSAVLGPSLGNVVIALSAMGWTGYARLVRAETLSIRERPHVESAIALGASPGRIVLVHVLPLLAGPLAVQATFGFAAAIVAEASLSFLGLGTQPPAPSWGAMLNDGRSFLLVAPHLTLFPGLAIFTTVLGANFLGDGLRDWLDVRGAVTLSADTPGSRSSIARPAAGA